MGVFHSCCDNKESSILIQKHRAQVKNCYGYHNIDKMNLLLSEKVRPLAIVNGSRKSSSHKKVSLADFTIMKILGRGSFGKVLLVEKTDTKKVYAMKVLKKEAIAQRNQRLHIMTEREILENMNSPFILQLHYAFQTETKLYLITDFMIGGELYFHLKKEKKFVESKACFYAAEIILALEYLHSHGIIYRDIKPENILLGADGHVKLADFNLCKQGVEEGAKTYTFCGTPEYLSPEILQGKGHNKAVDYWGLGALIYEMLAGMPPFNAADQHQMYMNILKPAKRLSNMDDLKSHDFFRNIDWKKLASLQVKPPFIPKCKHDKDMRYFDKKITEVGPNETPLHSEIDLKNVSYSLTYKGFTYDPICGEAIEGHSTEDFDFIQKSNDKDKSK